METPQTFRSAFNGFNREDVVHYIDYLNTRHSNEINQLNTELELLRSNQDPVSDSTDEIVEQQAARIRELFDRCTALEAERDQLLNAAAPADTSAVESAELEALKAENAELREKLASISRESVGSRTDEELQAYRRAERVERMAQERTEQMYRQANAALSDAAVQVDDAASQIAELSDKVLGQLEDLRTVVSASKNALQDASATLYAIRPISEEK